MLVVDHDLLTRRLIEAGLKHRFEVITAVSGVDGVYKAQTLGPDLVLLDLGLPDIAGSEVLRCLRATPAGRRLPVIVMTSDAGRDVELESIRDGVDDFMTKPLDLPILMARIDAVLQRSPARPRKLIA